MDIETQTIDIKEAAKLLGIGTRKLYQLCRDGGIPYIMIGAKQYKFLPEVLKDWLKLKNKKDIINIETQTINIETQTMNIQEAANFLGITEHKLRQLCRNKQIPVVNTGSNKHRFLPDILKDWLRSQSNSELNKIPNR